MNNSEFDDIVGELNFDFLNDPQYDLEPTIIPRDNLNLTTPIFVINRDLKDFKNKFIAGHLNVRSLPKNIIEFGEIVYNSPFDAVAVSETWLSKNTPKDRFTLNNFGYPGNE